MSSNREQQLEQALELAHTALVATIARSAGYDWNADPDGITRLQGDASAARDSIKGQQGSSGATASVEVPRALYEAYAVGLLSAVDLFGIAPITCDSDHKELS